MVWSLLGDILLLLVLIWFGFAVNSVVYHRHLTHRSVQLHRWVARVLTLLLQGLAFAPPCTWVASHTSHHAYTDLPEDPYSPQVYGFWKVFLLTPLLVTQ